MSTATPPAPEAPASVPSPNVSAATAATAATATPLRDPRRYETTRSCRVLFTDPEKLELGKKLASEYARLANTNSDLDRLKSEFKSRISSHEAAIGNFVGKIESGYHLEDVQCVWTMDDPKPLTKTLRRKDTFEIVETIPMAAADQQYELDEQKRLDEEEAGEDAVAGS